MRHDADEEDAPDAVVVRLTDDALFKCPYILMEDAGTADFSAEEARRLREYLLKGGFVFASDYWGDWAREQFDEQIGLALPPGQYPIVDLPLNHSIWHTLFDVKTVPQMPSIQSWRRSGGGNTDRGVAAPPSARGIADERGRLHGRDAAQHRYSRRLGTGRRGSRVLLSLLARRVRGRHQYRVVRDDALIT